jgi:hypothetical protein
MDKKFDPRILGRRTNLRATRMIGLNLKADSFQFETWKNALRLARREPPLRLIFIAVVGTHSWESSGTNIAGASKGGNGVLPFVAGFLPPAIRRGPAVNKPCPCEAGTLVRAPVDATAAQIFALADHLLGPHLNPSRQKETGRHNQPKYWLRHFGVCHARQRAPSFVCFHIP